MFWKGLTTRGAVIGGVVGLVTAVVLIKQDTQNHGKDC
jgi:cation/acetate symporter